METVERELQRLQEILSHNQAQQANRIARYYLRQHGTPKTPKTAATRAVMPSSASSSRVSPLRTSYTGLLESEGASLPSRGASWAVGGKAAATPSQVQRWMESANMSVRDGKGEIASPSQVDTTSSSPENAQPTNQAPFLRIFVFTAILSIIPAKKLTRPPHRLLRRSSAGSNQSRPLHLRL